MGLDDSMKNDIVLYERIFQLLKNQIECGVLPVGAKLPSRKELCNEFQVSEKTVRRVLELLSERNLIETQQKKRAVVKSPMATEEKNNALNSPEGVSIPKDMFRTGRLFCYPAIERGVSLCTGEDWGIPTAIVEQMDASRSTEFWLLSHRFWRFFIARNGNDLLLRAVDCLGFSSLEPLPGSLELREAYLKTLREYVRPAGRDGRQAKSFFEELAKLYGVNGLNGNESQDEGCYRVAPDSPLFIGHIDLEQRLRCAEERYSRVYMDLMGLIAIGRYQPGDRLPSHKELQKIYEVSSDTTTKAINVLQQWGVVKAKRGDGIYVAMDLAGLKHAKIPPELVGCHLRRFLDSLELLSITIDGVAAHAAAFISAEEAGAFRKKMDRLWNEEYLYQLTPIALLEFITEHIQYPHLKEIYRILLKNYHIGRSIPKLVTHEKTAQNVLIHTQGLEAVESLIRRDGERFSEKASAMFRYVHELVVQECKRLGYWEIAGKVYDGAVLWRKSNFSAAQVSRVGHFRWEKTVPERLWGRPYNNIR